MRVIRSRAVRRVVWLAVVTSACTGSSDAELDFTKALNRWRNAELVNYSYRVSVSCYCPEEYVRPMTVTVRSGAVVSVADRVTGAAHPLSYRTSVDSLFRIAATEIRVRPERLRVTYDASLGYPRTLTYGTPENDGGGVITADSVVVVP